MRLGCKAGVHDRQILIRQREVDHDIGLKVVDKRDKLVHVVGIHLRRRDFCFSAVKLFL